MIIMISLSVLCIIIIIIIAVMYLHLFTKDKRYVKLSYSKYPVDSSTVHIHYHWVTK